MWETRQLVWQLSLKSSGHLFKQLGGNHFLREDKHVFIRFCAGDTVTDDNWFIYAEYRRSSVVLKIKAVEVFGVDVLTFHYSVQGLCKFQDDITCESFTNQHIGVIEKYIAAFDVPYKPDLIIFFQQGIGSLGQNVSLPFFFADIDQTYPGRINSQDIFCIQRTQCGKLI